MVILNKEQKELINSIEHEKYILVKAPAGTGKTFCCIQSAKKYIETEKAFNKIYQKVLILTFSKNARAQLIKEVKKEESIARYVEITNYHSFMKKYIDNYCCMIGIKEEISIVEDERIKEGVIRSGLDEKESKKIPSIINNFCIAENKIINDTCKSIEIENAKNLITGIVNYSKATGELCFDEFGYLFNLILSKCKGISSYISQHYPLVILDEYQDTDYYQNEFLKKILLNSKAIFFADDLQMIYEFRGAKKERLEELKIMFPNIKIISFNEIFRYKDKEDIIDLLKRIRNNEEYNYESLENGKCISIKVNVDKTWRKSPKSKQSQLTILAKNIYWNTCKTIGEQLKANQSVAILCREKCEVKKIKKIFTENNYSVKSNKDSGELLNIANNLKEIIIPKPICENREIYVYLALMATNNDEIDGKNDVKSINILNVRSGLLYKIKDVFNSFNHQSDIKSKYECIEAIIDILKNNKFEINYSIFFFIKRCLSSEKITPKDIDKLMLNKQYINSYSEISCGLYIMTMHQSKGKEFDVVYIVDAENIKNETNLNYVSHSRMKKSVFPIVYDYMGSPWKR